MIAKTPEPPYYAVIFTSVRSEGDNGYQKMAERMEALAAQQEGFLGLENARAELGITVSYWRDLSSIERWKRNAEHIVAQQKGKAKWYRSYKVRVAKVEREYES
ncbi:MAG: antibiotic biosynthesis monooxygenase [Bacteroidia bacterium]